MIENVPFDVDKRPEIRRELFLDTRLAETGLPFDEASLTQGVGEVGLAGYYLQHGIRNAAPLKEFLTIAGQAKDAVAKTFGGHNRDARYTYSPHNAAYYMLSPSTFDAITSITTDVMLKWSRMLWTNDGVTLWPDRRAYRYRGDRLTEEELQVETHAKAVIVEIGAAVMEVSSQVGYNLSSERNQRTISSIVVGRGPEFLQRWLSKDILDAWLATTDRQDETESWHDFAKKSTLLRALQLNMINPLDELHKMKQAHDSLSTEAIVARTGWSPERVNKDFSPGTRKYIASRKNVEEALDTITNRFNEVSIENICAYTGWDPNKATEVFTALQQRKIAVERHDPVREAVMAIAQAHDFLEDSQNLADLLNTTVAEVDTMFTPAIRRHIVIGARPPQKSNVSAQQDSEIDALQGVKNKVLEVNERLALLNSSEAMGSLLGWTSEQISDRILKATIDHFATIGGNFTNSLRKFCQNLAMLDDAYLANLLHISEEAAQKNISWSVRQRCLIDHGAEPRKALIAWWQGKKKIGPSKRQAYQSYS